MKEMKFHINKNGEDMIVDNKTSSFHLASQKFSQIKYRAVVLNNPLELEKGRNFNRVYEINFFSEKVKLLQHEKELDFDDVILLPFICYDKNEVELYLHDIVKYTDQIYNQETKELDYIECELELRKESNGTLYFIQKISDIESKIYEFNDDIINHIERIGNYYEQWFS
jgi:hypothetical protein